MHDLIVIGAGPAGLGAALQAIHFGLDTLVIERDQIGGRLRYAGDVRNFPGTTAAHTTGVAVVKKLRAQAQRANMRIVEAECSSIDKLRSCFVAQTGVGEKRGRAVIIATGVRPNPANLAGSAEADDRVFYYWADLPAIRGKTVAVIGAGEVAFDQACSLAGRGANAVILARGKSHRVFPELAARAAHKGIRVQYNAPVLAAAAASEGGLVLRIPGKQVRADYILSATGSVPCPPRLTTAARSRMNRGIYLAGDVDAANSRQAAIAFGDGVQKAMRAYSFLKDGGPC